MMKTTRNRIRELVEEVVLEAIGDQPACQVEFITGETLPLYRAVRVIPQGNGIYFAGETTGGRGRGTTAATLPPGTQCRVIQRINRNTAWVECNELRGGRIRIDINKFCPTVAQAYADKKASRRVGGIQQAAPEASLEQQLEQAESEMQRAKEAYARAKRLAEEIRERMLGSSDESTNPGHVPEF